MVDWASHFRYDAASPSGLVRTKDWRCGKEGRILRALAGSPTGRQGTRGYITVWCEGKHRLAHRVVYELHHGPIQPGLDIDHIDGNKLNNQIENLRAVPTQVNMQNSCKFKNNSSGVTGVSLRNDTVNGIVYSRWVAQWYELGKRTPSSKGFSVRRYGYEQAFALACEYRQAVIARLNAEGGNYTERHGQ